LAEKITPRAEDYSRWYTDIVLRAELADYAPVKGCMVIRPHGYAIWERMQAALDKRIKETGHVNAYFPLLIPESFMKREAQHVEGFAPECAIVTHGGGKALEEPLYVRPTSETVIWHMYGRWIQSYRDLPLLINQWANIVRWEMRTRLFLRTTEFLWQEGHTAHATADEAQEETLRMLEVYREFAESTLALSVVTGRKTAEERFAGAVETYSIEAMMQDRRALQAGTSHFLGQNFAKAFDVTFQSEQGKLEYVWATSWGVSTRLLGAVIMAHSDDQGLILPPSIAPIEVVIVPIYRKEKERLEVLEAARNLANDLRRDFAVKLDDREGLKPGFKYNDWELRGVPVRLELGPRDLKAQSVFTARRDTGEKEPLPWEGLADRLRAKLDDIQKGILERSRTLREENTVELDTYDQLKDLMADDSQFVRAWWAGSDNDEKRLAEETKASIRCIPTEQRPLHTDLAKARQRQVHRDRRRVRPDANHLDGFLAGVSLPGSAWRQFVVLSVLHIPYKAGNSKALSLLQKPRLLPDQREGELGRALPARAARDPRRGPSPSREWIRQRQSAASAADSLCRFRGICKRRELCAGNTRNPRRPS